MEGLKIGKYEASVKTRELENLYKLEEIHHLLPGLREIAKHRRIVVLVDELDRGWDSSEDAQKYRDLIENIHWTEASLLKLMANRSGTRCPRWASSSVTSHPPGPAPGRTSAPRTG